MVSDGAFVERRYSNISKFMAGLRTSELKTGPDADKDDSKNTEALSHEKISY
jgi:hypothetical protein